MTETLANGYSNESTRRELSNEYQHDRVSMVFENICVLVLWMKVASALEGLNQSIQGIQNQCKAIQNNSNLQQEMFMFSYYKKLIYVNVYEMGNFVYCHFSLHIAAKS